MKLRIRLNNELHVGRENIKQSACEFQVDVPDETAAKIMAAMADMTTGLPYEHLVITTNLVGDAGEIIDGGKTEIRSR